MSLGYSLFILKKILSPLFLPVGIVAEMFILGILLRRSRRWRRSGTFLLALAIVALYFFSSRIGADLLNRPLEHQYPVLSKQLEDGSFTIPERARSARWVVLLGGTHGDDRSLPPNNRLDGITALRLVEALRIHRLIPESKLLLSGGAVFSEEPNADITAAVALALGVPADTVFKERESLDTPDQVAKIAKIVGGDQFIVVTSASHMPRSIWLFERRGLQPIPAPAGLTTFPRFSFSVQSLKPSISSLQRSQAAFHEYVGIIWAMLREK